MAPHLPIIDTDIHPSANRERILSYLPEPWRRLCQRQRWTGAPGLLNPNGVTRADTLLEDGSRIHASPATLSKYHLDEYGLTYGILNAGGLQLGLSPEPDFAATMVSAINDVFVNEWLPSDERLRYSLIVSPGDPALAAKRFTDWAIIQASSR